MQRKSGRSSTCSPGARCQEQERRHGYDASGTPPVSPGAPALSRRLVVRLVVVLLVVVRFVVVLSAVVLSAVAPVEQARLTAFVRGRVQGVGFRWWIRARALDLGLTGSATNLPDRRVEVVAEGPRSACALLLDLLEGPPSLGRPGEVTGVGAQWSAARGDLEGFAER